MNKVIFHVDMDAFYASVEQNDNPQYRGKPVIIGTMPGHRGVVSACSYEARKYGVHSAQPISQAYRLCPKGIYLPVRMSRYQEVSKLIFNLLDDYTPIVMQVSIDEAFMDMTGTERLFGKSAEAGRTIKKRIKDKTGCNISIGIAPNRFLAKLASEASKPDGLFEVKNDEIIAFLDKLKVKDLWGVGEKTNQKLLDLNLTSVEKIRKMDKATLNKLLGKGTGSYLYDAVRGTDPGVFRIQPESHSISAETTFAEDSKDPEGIKNTILQLSHQIMFRLYNSAFKGKTIVLKLRYADFDTLTVRKTLRGNVSGAEEIFDNAMELLGKKWDKGREIRLIGLGLANLQKKDAPEQTNLFEDDYDKRKKVEQAVFKIISDGNKVFKASLLKPKKSK